MHLPFLLRPLIRTLEANRLHLDLGMGFKKHKIENIVITSLTHKDKMMWSLCGNRSWVCSKPEFQDAIKDFRSLPSIDVREPLLTAACHVSDVSTSEPLLVQIHYQEAAKWQHLRLGIELAASPRCFFWKQVRWWIY